MRKGYPNKCPNGSYRLKSEENDGKNEREAFVFYFSNLLQTKYLLTSCVKLNL